MRFYSRSGRRCAKTTAACSISPATNARSTVTRSTRSSASPMQCMMKEICAQCLQVHRDPATGVESVVFSCFDQDQDLDRVDFDNLRARLNQNGVQEKLTRLWIDRSLRHLGLRQAAE